ncbi:MAG TPA: DUF2887 domain-containing protein [Gemmataceae bacterium]|nr:DUF2887 domain-containing protein [Gemmataceae bacterium]
MITDPIFYRLFQTSPETFFLLLGMSPESASAMAARYEYQAIEYKETSHRADGVFLPKEAGLPIYFFWKRSSIISRACSRIFASSRTRT